MREGLTVSGLMISERRVNGQCIQLVMCSHTDRTLYFPNLIIVNISVSNCDEEVSKLHVHVVTC